jgi:hypothetical protein
MVGGMSKMSEYLDAAEQYNYWKKQEGVMRTTPGPDLEELAEDARKKLGAVVKDFIDGA